MIKKKVLAVVAGVAAFVIISGTVATQSYSSFISQDKKSNSFKTGTIDIENVETKENNEVFQNITSWDASEKVKNVKINNKSRSPALIRTAIFPRWVNEDGTPFAGDTSIVTISYAKDTKWVDGKDGYYYYNEIVPTGSNTDTIINSVSANIPPELSKRYAGKKLIVDVRSEAVLAGKTKEGTGVYTKTWDVKNDSIKGILDKLSGITT